MTNRLLVIDDEPLKRSVLSDGLSQAGYQVTCAANAVEATQVLSQQDFDVIITDLRMPGKDGLTLVREIRDKKPHQPVIVMTAFGTVETAVEAMKLGAFDFLQKPFSTEELLLKLDKLIQFEKLASENKALRKQLKHPRPEHRIVGRSEAMRQIMSRIHAVAQTEATVLIEGESGTGKELIAREIHLTSPRCGGPFIPVSCAALPRDLIESELFGYEPGAFTGATQTRLGRFEMATGGTLFLDDIDDVPLEVQVKLVRVLQERSVERIGGQNAISVDVRILVATKKPLATLVAAGNFREDLYYRLNVVPLQIPPLHHRTGDIPLLAKYFLGKFAVKMNRSSLTFLPDAIKHLQAYAWPGNVRELEHTVERIVALTSQEAIGPAEVLPLLPTQDTLNPIFHLTLDGVEQVDMNALIQDVEQQILNWALAKTDGNLAQTSQLLGIPRSTLQYKVQKLVEGQEEDI
ncbi:MAG: sigma-54-dependent Fis family transcriptional regulator [Phycisphaeraceae bacterium]|nr:sigma-54-dependent Fis family transcriptional regulator [Phycisphaeraceae bacterium]